MRRLLVTLVAACCILSGCVIVMGEAGPITSLGPNGFIVTSDGASPELQLSATPAQAQTVEPHVTVEVTAEPAVTEAATASPEATKRVIEVCALNTELPKRCFVWGGAVDVGDTINVEGGTIHIKRYDGSGHPAVYWGDYKPYENE